MNEKKSNLLIDGLGSSSGGQFDRVRINGRGKISSDLNCTHFSCNGLADIDGNLQAEKAEINGFLTIEQDLKADELAVYGKTNVHGSIIANQMRVEGDVSITKDCTTNHFYSRGRIHLNGLLQAESLQMTIHGTSRLKEINGQTIHIKRGFKDMQFIKKIFSSLTPKIRVDTIEGEDIHLEYTQANVVKGKHISIGPGCEIETVQYEESFHQDTEAKVETTVKII